MLWTTRAFGFAVSGFRLTSNGLPAMVLTDGSAHVLHLSLKEWMCISSPTRVMMQHANGIHGIDSGEQASPQRSVMPTVGARD